MNIYTAIYLNNDLDKYIKDLIKYEDIITAWKSQHVDHTADILTEFDDQIITLTVQCRKK
ncbi:hypothetical protein EB001_07965 [bacterium]|nr:hypothetical protein [bacterium]